MSEHIKEVGEALPFEIKVEWQQTEPADETLREEQKKEAEAFVAETAKKLADMKELPAAIQSITIRRA